MSFLHIIYSYILTTIVFLIIDFVWLGLIAKNLYQKYLGHYLSDQVNWTAAIIFYLFYVVAISIFAIYPAVNKGSALTALLLGALFGFFAYATYDLVCLAVIRDWPLAASIVDMIWGAFIGSAVSGITFGFCRRLF